MASSNNMRMSRDDFKKQKELEELRKSGAIEPEKDEDGKDINPHIPQYIAQAPWYLDKGQASLKHQRASAKKELDGFEAWYKRGATVGKAAKKFRKGACENCGAMTHKKKECTERPRKLGAKHTQKDIKPDELVEGNFNLGYEGRRDRWNGYDAAQFQHVIKQYEELEAKRKEVKEKQVEEAIEKGEGGVVPEDDDDDDDVRDDNEKIVGQKFDQKTRTSVRNLRIREDTAKYLRNLDVNSAHYDPKTRSMRQNPLPDQDPSQVDYAGDNFVRYSGDTQEHARMQLFELQSYEKGEDVHLSAMPTQAAIAHNLFKEKKSKLETSRSKSILEKYGGEEYNKELPAELRFGQTEAYREYSRDGRLIKGEEGSTVVSKYEEDKMTNNHTKVWGSWWQDGEWGYACCHSKVRNSFCTGDAGKEAASMAKQDLRNMVEQADKRREAAAQKAEDEKANEEEEKKKRFKEALEREEKLGKVTQDELDERKRKYNSFGDAAPVTEEDMEAFMMKRRRADDPMANFVDTES